jgi:hypothetical protein
MLSLTTGTNWDNNILCFRIQRIGIISTTLKIHVKNLFDIKLDVKLTKHTSQYAIDLRYKYYISLEKARFLQNPLREVSEQAATLDSLDQNQAEESHLGSSSQNQLKVRSEGTERLPINLRVMKHNLALFPYFRRIYVVIMHSFLQRSNI